MESQTQLEMSSNLKKFQQSTWHLSSLQSFCGKQQGKQLSWEINKTSDAFIQAEAVPPSLWNACDYELKFNFKIARNAASVNTAADFLCRLELRVTEKVRLKVRIDKQATPIEVTTFSSDVEDEEHFFFTKKPMRMSQNRPLKEREQQAKQVAQEWVENEKGAILCYWTRMRWQIQ